MRWLLRYVSFRRLFEGRLRTFITMAGIASGVASLVATGAANEAVLDGVRSTLSVAGGDTELCVSSAVPGGFETAVLDRVRAVPGVKSATQLLIEGGRLRDGARLTVLGVDATAPELPKLDPAALAADPGAVAIPERLATRLGLKQDDHFDLMTAAGRRSLHVVALLAGDKRDALGGQYALMPLPLAQLVFARGPRLDRIDIDVETGASVDVVRDAIAAAAGGGLVVDRPADRGKTAERLLRSFQIGLAMGSAMALVVGAFLVFNVVSFAVSQRRREVGTLRALGVTRRRILSMFLAEAALIGLAGSVVGVGLGALLARVAVAAVLATVNQIYLQVNASTAAVSPLVAFAGVLLGVLGATTAAFLPAWDAASIPPVEALKRDRETKVTPGHDLRRRALAVVVILSALPLLKLPLVAGAPLFGNAALGAIALGAALLASDAVSWVRLVLARPVAVFAGIPGRIAIAGLARAKGRSAVAAGAVMVGLSLALAVATLVGSFRDAMVTWFERAAPADLFVTSGTDTVGVAATPMDASLGDELRKLDGVAEVQEVRLAFADLPTGRVGVYGMAWDVYLRHTKPSLTEGDPDTSAAAMRRGEVLLSDNLARKLGLHLGDQLTLPLPSGAREVRIAGTIIDYTSEAGTVFFDRPSFIQAFGDTRADSFYTYLRPGADLAGIRGEIERRWGEKFDLHVRTNAELRAFIARTVDDFFALMNVLMIIAVAVGVLGVAGALLAQVMDRIRETGVMRAMGTSRRQIVGAIALEASLLGAAGAVLGIPSGLAMGVVMVRVVGLQATGWALPMSLPLGLCVSGGVLAILGTALGGLLPARKAASLDVVEALSYE